MEISLFKGANKTEPIIERYDWTELCALFEMFAVEPCRRSDKLDREAFIFGRCAGKRAKANIKFLSGLAADFDLSASDPRYIGFDDMCARLDAEGRAYIAYTTTANDAGHNHYRLVMPYAEDVPAERCQAAWYACNAKFGGAFDPATKDESRLSFMPADWTENPFQDRSKGTVQLHNPFNRIAVRTTGKPILSAGEIGELTVPAASAAARTVQSSGAPLTDAERLAASRGKGIDDPYWQSATRLERNPLITPDILRIADVAGNRTYRFMLAVARRALVHGYPITAEALALLAEEFRAERLNKPPRADLPRQAQNALAFAVRSHPSGAPCQSDAGVQP